MPQTKKEQLIFSVLMIFVMVYGMEVYNFALMNQGLENRLFLAVFHDLVPMAIICYFTERFLCGPTARRLAFRLVNPAKDAPILVTVIVSAMTAAFMCPTMSLWATLLFNGSDAQIFSKWVQTMAFNFPMALCWQLFFAGPLVRFLFHKLCPQKITVAETLPADVA